MPTQLSLKDNIKKLSPQVEEVVSPQSSIRVTTLIIFIW